MTDITNEKLFEMGVLIPAVKLPLATIDLGKVSALSNLPGVIWNANGMVVISTKEFPEGHVFQQDLNAFVRFGGVGFKVKTNGFYDIEAFDTQKIKASLGTPYELSTLPANILTDLKPLIDVASDVTHYICGSLHGFSAIIVTNQMVGSLGYIMCHCSGDPDTKLTKLHYKDVFLVEDAEAKKGFKISMEEFKKYYYFE